jgi:hypothetical protein
MVEIRLRASETVLQGAVMGNTIESKIFAVYVFTIFSVSNSFQLLVCQDNVNQFITLYLIL